MEPTLKKGAKGQSVETLQKLLRKAGFEIVVDGDFGRQTQKAVRAFQTENLDKHGWPLVVDGTVGPLTWWSLKYRRRKVLPIHEEALKKNPSKTLGGSKWGRAALKKAIKEMKAGATEIGGNNRGPWVKKYLNGLAPEGSHWCAAFVSWCYSQNKKGMPFDYCLGARATLRQFAKKRWDLKLDTGQTPEPGDIVCWWRESYSGWKGHIGLVHKVEDGYLYTIEGNKKNKVSGCTYVLSRMEKLLGFGRVPDDWEPES